MVPVVLIIDDDKTGAWALSMVLQQAGYDTCVVPGRDILLELDDAGAEPTAIISEYHLPGELDGVEGAKTVSAKMGRSLPTIITAYDHNGARREAVRASHVFCPKPMDPKQILGLLEAVLKSKDGCHCSSRGVRDPR